MREELPAGVLDMLRIPGLRQERVRKLYKELGIASAADLEDAARSGRLAATKGFGPAFQAKVLQGIEMSRGPQGRHLHRADAALRFAVDAIAREHPDWMSLTPAGEFRRGCELVSALSLVAIDPHLAGADRTIEQGDQLVVHVTAPARFGIALLLATGSDAHLKAVRALARRKGLSSGCGRPVEERPYRCPADGEGNLRGVGSAVHRAGAARIGQGSGPRA